MKASTAILLVVTLFAMLIAGGGGALLVASQKDRDAGTALPATPVNVNNTLSREYRSRPIHSSPIETARCRMPCTKTSVRAWARTVRS